MRDAYKSGAMGLCPLFTYHLTSLRSEGRICITMVEFTDGTKQTEETFGHSAIKMVQLSLTSEIR